MRRIAVAAALLVGACAATPPAYVPVNQAELQRIRDERLALEQADRDRAAAAEAALTPDQRAQRDRQRAIDVAARARMARENSLLEDALSGRPDYTAALRRAAEANISEENPVVRQTRAQREARIDAEVARLSDAVEKRRREVLAQRQQQQRSAQDQAAIDACQARGAQIEASMFDRRSILNLEAAATGAQIRDACIQNYLRSR